MRTIAGLLLAAGCILFLTMKRLSAEERLLKQFKRTVLLKYGVDIPASSGLHEAVKSLDNPAVQEFIDIYSAVLYRDRKLTSEELITLKRLLNDIKKA